MFFDTPALKHWFLSEKRDLPWRNSPSPYAVWVSEVMLQQTQVSVVIPYFLRWMERFPTIVSLAAAPLDEIIKMWEGLGYYSRARNLHAGAQYIVEHYQGILPQDEEKLQKIKGLGPYTIGAILSFAFHKKKAAVDGNVLRVLARYYQIEEDISKPSTIKKLRVLAENLLPDDESWIVNEGLIELGATICQKKARCHQCPLKSSCKAYINHTVDQLPIKSAGPKTEYLYRAVAIILHKGHYLIKRGKEGEIMHDLHEFPFFETTVDGFTDMQLEQAIWQKYGLLVKLVQPLSTVAHSFTRYQVKLNPVLFESVKKTPIEGLDWISLVDLKRLAFSSGHRRILQQLSLD